jgi:aryl-alcohol dehydrogenase-like predicted oxidoreductase
MRYRPLGSSAAVVSAISLNLSPNPARPRPADWVRFVHAALEHGISAFEVDGDDPVVVDGLAQALSAVDRALVFVSWRLNLGRGGVDPTASPKSLAWRVQAGVARTGLTYLDALMLDEPAAAAVSDEHLEVLDEIRALGAARLAGLCGEGDAVTRHLASGRFDILTTAFSLASGGCDRDRIQSAKARGMAVMGRRPHCGPVVECGDFGWTAQEVSLAYALAEPSLASVQVEAGSAGELGRLAAVAERPLPPALAARIEAARFAGADAEVELRA